MGILIAIVVIILVFSLIGTLILTRKSDENYSKAAKQNTANLTVIYTVVILLSLIVLGIYIRMR